MVTGEKVMPDIAVKVKTDSLNIGENKSRLITGEICFAVGDMFFPELRWNDFVVIVLTWWVETVTTIRTLEIGTTCEFRFMDGPFLVKGLKTGQDTMRMNFVKDKLNGEDILFSVDCKITNLTISLLRSAKEVIEEANKRKWVTKEIADLHSALKHCI